MLKSPWLAVLILAIGCSGSSEPDGFFIEGVVVARDTQVPVGGSATIHVRKANDQCGVYFRVATSTPIKRRANDGSTSPATYADLTIGTPVRVWTTVVAESCPGQASAEFVDIVPATP